MMTTLLVLLTVLLILDCLILGLLILIQLPKKEAGVGLAFGGGATDALFGSGSGTALSNLTKYTAGAFFVLVFALSVANNHATKTGVSELKRELQNQSALPTTPPPAATPSAPAANAGAGSTMPAIPLTISTNSISTTPTPASNAPAK
jgi:protein translocase SecG subunit